MGGPRETRMAASHSAAADHFLRPGSLTSRFSRNETQRVDTRTARHQELKSLRRSTYWRVYCMLAVDHVPLRSACAALSVDDSRPKGAYLLGFRNVMSCLQLSARRINNGGCTRRPADDMASRSTASLLLWGKRWGGC